MGKNCRTGVEKAVYYNCIVKNTSVAYSIHYFAYQPKPDASADSAEEFAIEKLLFGSDGKLV